MMQLPEPSAPAERNNSVAPGEDAPNAGVHGKDRPVSSRFVFGRGVIYSLGITAPVIGHAMVTPAVTRTLGVSAYGQVAVGLAILQVGMILCGLGLSGVITRQGFLGPARADGARALTLWASALSLTLSLVLIGVSLLSRQVVPSVSRTILFALAGAGLWAVMDQNQAVLRVLDAPMRFVGLAFVGTVVGPCIGLVLIQSQPSAERYLAGLAIGYLVAAMAGTWLSQRSGRRSGSAVEVRAALGMSLPLLPHLLAVNAVAGSLILLMSWLGSDASAGRLSVALIIGMAPGFILAALNNSWAPVVYMSRESDRAPVLEETSRDLAWTIAVMAGLVALLAPQLLLLAAGSDFGVEGLTPAVAAVAAGSVIGVVYMAHVNLVFASGTTWPLAISTPAALVVGVATAACAFAVSPVAVALGYPAMYLAMAVGAAAIAGRVSSTVWRRSVLVPPVGIGITVCVVGGLIPETSMARFPLSLALMIVGGWRLSHLVRRDDES